MTSKFYAALLISSGLAILAAPAWAGSPAAPSLLPPVSNPGECYARVKVPAQFESGRHTLITEEGYNTVNVRQPVLESRQENVMVKEASTRFRVRQPQYRSVTEQMLVRPAYDKLSVVAPQFSTVKERVQISAPQLVWKQGNPAELRRQGYIIHSTADGRISGRGSYSEMTPSGQAASCGAGCEIWCLVEEPGKSTMVSRKVMSSPGRVARTPVAPKYQTIVKQLVSDPGGVEEVFVPAEFRSVTVEDVVDPGGEEFVSVPPKYGAVRTQQLIVPESYEWRRVLCAPGTASSGYSSSSSSYGHNGAGYGRSTSHSSSSYSAPTHSESYTAPSAKTYTYDGMGYGENSGSFSSGSTLNPQSELSGARSGYYGTENYPAYHNKSTTGAKRYRRRH